MKQYDVLITLMLMYLTYLTIGCCLFLLLVCKKVPMLVVMLSVLWLVIWMMKL